jgi:hypothetical protein
MNWRSLGDSNPCFRRERVTPSAPTPLRTRSSKMNHGLENAIDAATYVQSNIKTNESDLIMT